MSKMRAESPVARTRARRRALSVLLCAIAVLARCVHAQNELAGVSLRCCVLEQSPYVMGDTAVPEYGNWSGLAFDVRFIFAFMLRSSWLDRKEGGREPGRMLVWHLRALAFPDSCPNFPCCRWWH
jgi:hypothetical protein